ncbi:hematopoietic prostaglandin D synthase-like [Mytilus galloprovincialis]|uniref:HPGDS n=1 Tax=Mytilus edulis TaxID=6550 RepID=A0A8S3UY63_MYTED|nr:HPGDS [Mytilus edulis]
MADYKLYYFPIRGRAELTRIMCVAAGIKFDDIRVPGSEWPEKKKTFPNGKMPMLEYKGQYLTQSLAIARFIAKTCGLAGKSDWDQAQVDQIVYTVNDLSEEFYSYFLEKDSDKKEEKIRKVLNEYVPDKLATFEEWLKQNKGGDGFFVGSTLTMADVAVYEGLTSVLQKDTNLLDKFPKLLAHRQRIAGYPRIKEYLAKRECTEV